MRITKEEQYMQMAEVAAKRSTCSKMSVGATLVKNDMVISTGYNGSERGTSHCPHPHPDGKCAHAIHAEMNTILQAARNGVCIEGAEMYITHSPCLYCSKCLINSGIKKVYYRIPHKTEENKYLKILNAEQI